MMKQRIEFDTMAETIAYRKENGGWVVKMENGRSFWYCMGWTPTPIMLDMRGSGTINPAEAYV